MTSWIRIGLWVVLFLFGRCRVFGWFGIQRRWLIVLELNVKAQTTLAALHSSGGDLSNVSSTAWAARVGEILEDPFDLYAADWIFFCVRREVS